MNRLGILCVVFLGLGAVAHSAEEPPPAFPGAEGFGAGFYMQPTAVLAPSTAARVCREEIYGPFASFLVYDTLDEAIRIANDSSFGLVCYLWSQDLDAAMRVSREVRAGTVWINSPMMRELRAPFGGCKASGVGRDGATSSAEFFTELKTTTIPVEPHELRRLGAACRDA